MLVMKTPAPEAFRSARHFAAWLGLTPKDHSTAGKVRLGVITRAGEEALRNVLMVGATTVIQQVRPGSGFPLAVAGSLAQAQGAKADHGGAGQQDRPDRLEADGLG
jgi:transposase